MKIKLLKTNWFIIALITLLINDFFLKEIFNNWFTGKLSDFAGLFVFSVFWIAIFPKHKIKILVTIALLFTVFKSPYSQFVINLWNNIGIFSISRVVDITDLIALSILPLAYYFANKPNLHRYSKIPVVIPLIISSFAFLATSYVDSSEINKDYIFDMSKDSLKRKLLVVNVENYILPIKRDTVEMRMSYSICSTRKVSVALIFEELSENKTKLTLDKAYYDCSEKEEYRTKIIDAFDSLIVEKLNKNYVNYIKTLSLKIKYKKSLDYADLFECSFADSLQNNGLFNDTFILTANNYNDSEIIKKHLSPNTCKITFIKTDYKKNDTTLIIFGFIDKKKYLWKISEIEE